MRLNIPFRRRTEDGTTEVVAHRARRSARAICFIRGSDAGTWGGFPDVLATVPEIEDHDLFSISLSAPLRFDVAAAWSTPPALEAVSPLLGKAVALAELTAYESLAMVAHSIGGLVLQRALADDGNLRKRVSHVVLFATPSAGITPPSAFKAWKRYVREMEPTSAFMSDLRTRWKPGSEPAAFAIAASNDSFVVGESALAAATPGQQAVAPATHLELVDPKTPQDVAVRVLVNHLIGQAEPAGSHNGARVALALRDFARVVEDLAPHKADLDFDDRFVLAAAYEGIGHIDDALGVLDDHGMDALGILAGRRKRRWLAGADAADAEAALALYRRGHEAFGSGSESPLAVYHAMNVALLSLAYKQDVPTCRSYASLALHHAMSAPSNDRWRYFAEGCAHLMLGADEVALVRYRQALGFGPSPRETESMLEQASQISVLQEKPETAKRLLALFRRPAPVS